MIFGVAKLKHDGLNKTPFHPWFAWRPVHLIDRRWAWLETIERGGYFLREVPVEVPFNQFTDWCYRAPVKPLT